MNRRVNEPVEAEPQWDGFYTLPAIARLTGIPVRTIYDWRMHEIILPSTIIREGKRTEEGYSYTTATIVRLLRWLREYRVDFHSAANAFRHLYERLGSPGPKWADQNVHFVGRHIFVDGQDGLPPTDASMGGQFLFTRLFRDVFEEIGDLREGESILIPKPFREDVEINPRVMGGEPVVKGTRIPTSSLIALRKSGYSEAKIVRLYAPTPPRRIRACLAYEQQLDRQAA